MKLQLTNPLIIFLNEHDWTNSNLNLQTITYANEWIFYRSMNLKFMIRDFAEILCVQASLLYGNVSKLGVWPTLSSSVRIRDV